MDDRFECEDADLLRERLIRVENAIFCLEARAECLPDMDRAELERLEELRLQIRSLVESHSRSLGEIAS